MTAHMNGEAVDQLTASQNIDGLERSTATLSGLAAACSAQVKEEPAQRAGDTEQSAQLTTHLSCSKMLSKK